MAVLMPILAPPVAPLSETENSSVLSVTLSLRMGTLIVFSAWPAAKVSVPDLDV